MADPGRGPDDADDRRLLARVAGGDAAALGALFDRHGGACLGLAGRLLGDGPRAEPAAFRAVWRDARAIAPAEAPVGARLLGVTRRQCLAMRRGRPSDPPAARVPPGPDPPPAGARGDAGALRGIGAGDIRRALAALPPGERDALELAVFEGLTRGEIAARLGLAPSAVAARLGRALEAVRAHLGARAGDSPSP